jgi:hypothetical protein
MSPARGSHAGYRRALPYCRAARAAYRGDWAAVDAALAEAEATVPRPAQRQPSPQDHPKDRQGQDGGER